MNVWDMRRYIN